MPRSYSEFSARKLIKEHAALCAAGERHGTTKYSWGQGLVLAVGPTGTASWIARVQAPSGKRRDIGVGKFDDVSITEARASVADHKRVAREGMDPKAVKDAERVAARSTMPTFEEAAKSVHAERADSFRNPKHRDQWLNSLRDHVFGSIGAMRIDEIDVPAITRTIKPIWHAKPETARRVLQRVVAISAWAVAHGYRDHELAVRATRMGLGRQAKRDGHFAAVPVPAAPEAFKQLSTKDSLSARCLTFAILTAARSSEARGARWSEIDLDLATWAIPPERTKTSEEHIVALSPLAISILKAVPVIENPESFVFPSSTKRPLSDVALSKALKTVAPDATVHGWRSTFRDWAAERTNIRGDIAEAALAHVVPSKTEAAYKRTKYLEQRRPLMAAWADFLTGASAEITDLNEHRKMKESTG